MSASTAAASMTTTMTPPIVPRGFLRSIWIQTSTYQGRVRGRRSCAGFDRAIDSWGEASERGRSRPPRLVADARIQKRIREIDEEVEAHDHRRDDQVHRLDDRVVELVEGLEEKEPDTGQSEDRLDDHGAADVERHLQTDQADHRDQRVLERMAEHDRPLAEALGPGGPDVFLAQHVEQRGALDAHDR